MCLLAFSQADPAQELPKELIPALHSLLQSLEQEVQTCACRSLSNLLRGNMVSVDEILTEDTTEALLESLESSDSALQDAACSCLIQLLPLPGCSKVMVDSGAVIPLLVLAKGYEPRVQLAAVTALRTLATSSWGRTALQADGAFPILVLLLQSSDPELQYCSSGALAALSVDRACRISLLNLGDRLLLKALIQLTSSPVEKVCCQACSCLQVLATEDHVQKHLISPATLQWLHSLLSSGSCTIQHAALSLLHSLSCNPTSKETLLAHGLVQTLCDIILENQLTPLSTGLAANMLEHLTEPSSLRLILGAHGPEALLQAVDKLQTFSDCESSMALVLCALAYLLKFDAVQSYIPPTYVSHSVRLLLCVRAAYSCPHVRLHVRNALLYLTQECRAESLGSFLPGVVDMLEVLLTEHDLHSQELALFILISLTPDPFVGRSVNQGILSRPVRELSVELDKVRDLVDSLLTRCQSHSRTPSPGAMLDPS
uniref:uncharacterized protein n=1 Tax=Myxine glutinosa TaxID=7769 RepID=UPI00358EA4E0